MFVISKFVGFFLQPLAWVGLLLVLALLMGRWRGPAAGRRWTMAALTLLVFLGSEVPPTLLLRPLEDRYPTLRCHARWHGRRSDPGRDHGTAGRLHNCAARCR